MDPYKISFEIPGTPDLPNAVNKRSWQSGYSKATKWKGYVMLSVGNKRPPKPLMKAKLVLTRCSSREPDRDNLMASFKAVIDGLRVAGVISNDRSANIGTPEVRWRFAPARRGKIIVEVEEC